MKRSAFFLASIVLSGCTAPGAKWVAGGPDLKVKDSLAAIMIAQDVCRNDIAGLTGRARQDFFEHQRDTGWTATLADGVWHAGVNALKNAPTCFQVGAEINALTGKAGTCLECVVVG